jgi:hypothetical protein
MRANGSSAMSSQCHLPCGDASAHKAIRMPIHPDVAIETENLRKNQPFSVSRHPLSITDEAERCKSYPRFFGLQTRPVFRFNRIGMFHYFKRTNRWQLDKLPSRTIGIDGDETEELNLFGARVDAKGTSRSNELAIVQFFAGGASTR